MASKETAKAVVIEEEKKQLEEEAANAVGGGGDEADVPPQTPAEEEPDTVGMYSVWAIPPDCILPSLHSVMTQLSERYAGPPFQPHVTVLGAHPVLRSKAQQSLQQLCATTLPYTFKVTGVTTDLKFHQCVYLTMEPTQEVGLSVCLSVSTSSSSSFVLFPFLPIFLFTTSLLQLTPWRTCNQNHNGPWF